MNVTSRMIRFAAAGLLLVLGACGGGSDESGGGVTPPPPPQTGIGPAGGTVLGPNGAKIEIPPGALATNTEIKVELTSGGAPALPAGFTPVGQMFAFTPHGTTFAVPVTTTLPFDPASVPAGITPALFKTNAQNQWEEVANATFGAASVSAQVTSFSDLTAVIPPLVHNNVVLNWLFAEYRGDALEEVEVAIGSQTGGLLQEFFDYGPAFFDNGILFMDGTMLEPDGIATGEITSSADGVTYWVGAEAPLGNAVLPNDPIGSKASLLQHQTFTKNASNASYKFTLSSASSVAFLQVGDGNGALARACPPGRDLSGIACDLIKSEIHLEVLAYIDEPDTEQIIFFSTAGGATLNGSAGSWLTSVWNEGRTPLWTTEDFDFSSVDFKGPEGASSMDLTSPRTYTVDLSSVAVGESFTVRVDTFASTYNRAAGVVSGRRAEFETFANAWWRNPLTIGGTTVTTTGLTPVDTPLPLVEPVEVPVAPEACLTGPGPDPEAGVLQFGAASFTLAEANFTPTITVTRTGGGSGAVTATFTTSDGTAIADVDYTSVNSSVFFADGDMAERVVVVPIIQDLVSAEPDKTVNLTLSQPGGCAALGTPITAVLTIRDDDPAPPLPSGLDPGFGNEGEATSTAFGGDRSAMALQADGKIVMVGGTFTDFILARFKADGTLDGDFGSGGKVTTNMVSGEQQEALGVAIQPDGKIVVVGHTGQAVGPNVFALARYKEDGSLDDTFGVGGKVISTVPGRAFAVAIQTDGPDVRIVVAGDDLVAEDFALARFNANGNLDASFGNGGRINTDFDLGSELAGNIVLQSDGAILVSGPHTNEGEVTRNQHTALARYDADGNPDDSFGIDGKLTLSGMRVGEGLALQNDGKIVLVGNDGDGVDTSFATTRLEADGSPDNTFGDAGTVSTSISGLGDSALAVAIQGDDKIVVAGRSSSQVNSNFAVARYNPDGALDTDFINGGPLTIDFFGFTDIAESVAIQPDGKIVLGGLARDNNVGGYGVARVVP